MKLISPAFSNGGAIPDKFGFTAENINPPLKIEETPTEAESLVLIMDEPDAFKEPDREWDHWIVWNIKPDTTKIPENSLPSEADEGKTDFGKTGYNGPNPPDEVHTYRFRLYALDTLLDLPEGSDKKEVEEAMKNHILEKAFLTGTYAPWQPKNRKA